jgi:hypothetical protein
MALAVRVTGSPVTEVGRLDVIVKGATAGALYLITPVIAGLVGDSQDWVNVASRTVMWPVASALMWSTVKLPYEILHEWPSPEIRT